MGSEFTAYATVRMRMASKGELSTLVHRRHDLDRCQTTELPNSISEADVAAGTKQFYAAQAIPADSFARCVIFAIEQPEDVDIIEILYRPTIQEY